jgi:CheY-like chemotaxis protein
MPHTLLLADDSVTIQRVIELTFADEDVQVVAVGDGHAAIARLQADPPPDIVLADVGMPGPDGYEVATFVQQTPRLRHIPVVLLTGAFEPVDDARARAAGTAGVLVKPFEPQMVIARVRELLGRSQSAAGASAAAAAQEREEPTAADALLAARPAETPDAGRAASVDDYFDRLDAAFASLNVPLEPAVGRADASRREPSQQTASPAPAAPAPAAAGPSNLTMADAFGALLGIEQGKPAPVLHDEWQPAISEELVEQMTRQIADQVAERVIRELAPDIVSRVAERLVREEIERLRAAAQTA